MISVIVPVYKTEAYLDRCVQSVLSQQNADFELILVDDGSPDRCGELCDGYAADARVRALHHPENRGLSAARNTGIDAAEGDYLIFLDSDDELVDGTLAYFAGLAEHHPELVLIVANGKEPDGRPFETADGAPGTLSPAEFLCRPRALNRFQLRSACGKLYSAAFLRKTGLRFDTGLRYGEDAPFMLDVLAVCGDFWLDDRCVYVYHTGRSGSLCSNARLVPFDNGFAYYTHLLALGQRLALPEATLCLIRQLVHLNAYMAFCAHPETNDHAARLTQSRQLAADPDLRTPPARDDRRLFGKFFAVLSGLARGGHWRLCCLAADCYVRKNR